MTETIPESRASIITVDFSKGPHIRQHKSGRIRHRGDSKDLRPVDADGKLLTPKQIRARMRRKDKRARRNSAVTPMTEVEFEALYKPIEEWDLEELARGRPRDANGGFKGRKPTWITREMHERAMEVFIEATKSELGALAPMALDTLRYVLGSEETDERGKPIVPAAAKLQATHLVIEHIVGKPKQHVQQDISVKLQGLLGSVMVNPNEALAPPEQGGMGGFSLAHLPGQTIPMGELGPAQSDGDEDLDDE